MRKNLLILLSSVLIGFCSCSKDDGGNEPIESGNNPPFIHFVSTLTDTIYIDETAQLHCLATDDDNDRLTYSWTSEYGSFPNGNNEEITIWEPPLEPGTYKVTVSVFDSKEVVQDEIHITVKKVNCGESIEYEILLIDNVCTDDTVSKAQKHYSNPRASLRIIQENTPGLVFARKRGAINAKYNIISFLDDDNIPEIDWVNIVYNLFKNESKIGIVGRNSG